MYKSVFAKRGFPFSFVTVFKLLTIDINGSPFFTISHNLDGAYIGTFGTTNQIRFRNTFSLIKIL